MESNEAEQSIESVIKATLVYECDSFFSFKKKKNYFNDEKIYGLGYKTLNNLWAKGKGFEYTILDSSISEIYNY